MTEPTPGTEVGDDTAAATPADDNPDLPQNLDQARKLRSENKTLRERLHAAETAAEESNTHLGNMRRAEVERVAAAELIDPADLWSAHDGIDGFLTEDGTIDAQRVTEAAQSITAAKPHLAAEKRTPPPPSARPLEGLRRGASTHDPAPAPTWADALRR